MGLYTVNGLTGATLATDAHCIMEVWNPSSTRIIRLRELSVIAVAAPGAGAGFVTRRSTAKGTAGATVTPTIEHHGDRINAPDSAFTIEMAAFSAQPTLAAGELGPAWVFAATAASGILVPVLISIGLRVPPGQGVCLVNRAAIIFPAAEWTVIVEEES